MAGAWTSPHEIADESFWREFRRRVKAVNPDAYIVAEVWHEEPRYLQGDQYDAYMNYPLAAAIISFAARRAPRPARPPPAFRTGRHDPPDRRGRRSRGAWSTVLGLYDPAVVAVQLNLLDTPRHARASWPMASGDMASLRLAIAGPDDRAGSTVDLLRRRDRDDRRAGSRQPRRVPVGRSRHLGPGPPRVHEGRGRRPPRLPGPAPRVVSNGRSMGRAMAFVVRRPVASEGRGPSVVAINAGRCGPSPGARRARSSTGAGSSPIDWPGSARATGPGEIDVIGGRATVTIPPRDGAGLPGRGTDVTTGSGSADRLKPAARREAGPWARARCGVAARRGRRGRRGDHLRLATDRRPRPRRRRPPARSAVADGAAPGPGRQDRGRRPRPRQPLGHRTGRRSAPSRPGPRSPSGSGRPPAT